MIYLFLSFIIDFFVKYDFLNISQEIVHFNFGLVMIITAYDSRLILK